MNFYIHLEDFNKTFIFTLTQVVLQSEAFNIYSICFSFYSTSESLYGKYKTKGLFHFQSAKYLTEKLISLHFKYIILLTEGNQTFPHKLHKSNKLVSFIY